MNIAYVTSYDEMGQNFNGHLLSKQLNRFGHQANMLVFEKLLNDPDVTSVGSAASRKINNVLCHLENQLSLHSVLPIISLSILQSPIYQKADIVHLQLLHARQFFSILTMPWMSRNKPIVWTIHDPWITTGHCVYTFSCNRWMSGCGQCPDLERPIKMRADRTALNWKIKKFVMNNSHLHLIVASKWMYELVKKSPILSHMPCTQIPFGIDLEVFKPGDRSASRMAMGIPEDAHVMAFRSTPQKIEFKGTHFIEKALSLYQPTQPTYLITFDSTGGLESIRGKYHFVELGWVKDQAVMQQALSASDLFLMPSTAEAFGLMAIEAMACGLPVVVFDGTSLPDVVHYSEGGFVVPYQDSKALAQAISTLLTDQSLRKNLGDSALKLAQREYSINLYVDRHLELYKSMISNPKML